MTRTTVADQVLEQLGELILTEQIRPGDKFPNERELASMFGTTRARIREAFRALALIGLIETRPGDGSYVATSSDVPSEALGLMFFREMRQYDDLYEARQTLEPSLYVLAARHVKESDITQLEQLVDRCERVLRDSGDTEEFYALTDQYDQLIAALTQNAVLEKLTAIFRAMSREMLLKLLQVPGAMSNSVHRRREITLALRSRDSESIRRAVNKHMESARQIYRTSSSNDD